MVNKTSRYSVQEVPTTLPGHCLICNNHKGPFINPGIKLRFGGFVLICKSCIKEMGSFFPDPPVEEPEPVPSITEEEIREHASSLVTSLADIAGRLDDFRDRFSIPEDSEGESRDSERTEESSGQDGEPSGESDPAGISSDSSNEPGDLFAGLSDDK